VRLWNFFRSPPLGNFFNPKPRPFDLNPQPFFPPHVNLGNLAGLYKFKDCSWGLLGIDTKDPVLQLENHSLSVYRSLQQILTGKSHRGIFFGYGVILSLMEPPWPVSKQRLPTANLAPSPKSKGVAYGGV